MAEGKKSFIYPSTDPREWNTFVPSEAVFVPLSLNAYNYKAGEGRGGEVSHPASPSPASTRARPLGMLVTQPKDDGDSLVFVWTDGSGTPIGGVHKRGLFCASSLRHSAAITRTRTADSGRTR